MYKLCKNKKSKIPNKYGILFAILRPKSHQKEVVDSRAESRFGTSFAYHFLNFSRIAFKVGIKFAYQLNVIKIWKKNFVLFDKYWSIGNQLKSQYSSPLDHF